MRRRCFYHWVDYPSFDREMEILQARAPEAAAQLSREVVAFVQRLRTGKLEDEDWPRLTEFFISWSENQTSLRRLRR